MSDIKIRKAKISDTESVRLLLAQLGYELPISKLDEALASTQRNDDIVVCTQNGEVLGVMSLIYFDYFPSLQRICRITAIVVDESARGSGIGTRLITFAQKSAQENACQVLEVTTSLIRESTQKYYESIGFEKSSYRYFQKL